jgi:epoxyqueuosine reductase
LKPAALKTALIQRARALGFIVARITSATLPERDAEGLGDFVAQHYHGDMDWMAETFDRRKHPQALWPEARSAIVLGMSYAPDDNPLAGLALRDHGLVSAYARARDYHDEIKGKLKQCAGLLAAQGHGVKVFVDTAPLMEKPLARQSGMGWQGKHTVLVSRTQGNWLLLGIILTTADLPPDEPEKDHCGSCRRCLDICPTKAFPAPYQLDARRCITYLTVEHKGPIPQEFRKAIGNRIFGCDDCLAVCPWNKFAVQGRTMKRETKPELARMPLRDLLHLDEAAFRKTFATTPVKRTGFTRFMRNVLIAAGNSGERDLLVLVKPFLMSDHALLRGAAIWAFSCLASLGETQSLFETMAKEETDQTVLAEWTQALLQQTDVGSLT